MPDYMLLFREGALAQILALPIEKREKPISVIMVSYMTGPALHEAIRAVMNLSLIHI